MADQADFLARLLALLSEHGIRFCVLGGQGVNAYAEPVVSLDLDLAIAVDQLPEAERLLSSQFRVEKLPHCLNVSELGSDLRVQIQTDPRYAEFVQRAVPAVVLGVTISVAALEDVYSKLWAVKDRSDVRASARRIWPTSRDSWKLILNYARGFRSRCWRSWCEQIVGIQDFPGENPFALSLSKGPGSRPFRSTDSLLKGLPGEAI